MPTPEELFERAFGTPDEGGGDDLGLAARIGGGLVAGLREDPILGTALEAIVDFAPGIDVDDLDQMESQLGSSSPVAWF